MEALIQIVDEHDQPVRAATKQEAWDKGLIHRVVRIMIHNKEGQVLLQRRGPKQTLFPGRWDNSAAGHVDAGEDYGAAAQRELQEELGIDAVSLSELGRYRSDETVEGRRLNRFTCCYRMTVNQTPDKLGKDEVESVRWFEVADMKELVKDQPDEVSDGLRQVAERYY